MNNAIITVTILLVLSGVAVAVWSIKRTRYEKPGVRAIIRAGKPIALPAKPIYTAQRWARLDDDGNVTWHDRQKSGRSE
jgi:hypothetical protein